MRNVSLYNVIEESILIFGPGESKGELKKHLEREGLGGRISWY